MIKYKYFDGMNNADALLVVDHKDLRLFTALNLPYSHAQKIHICTKDYRKIRLVKSDSCDLIAFQNPFRRICGSIKLLQNHSLQK